MAVNKFVKHQESEALVRRIVAWQGDDISHLISEFPPAKAERLWELWRLHRTSKNEIAAHDEIEDTMYDVIHRYKTRQPRSGGLRQKPAVKVKVQRILHLASKGETADEIVNALKGQLSYYEQNPSQVMRTVKIEIAGHATKNDVDKLGCIIDAEVTGGKQIESTEF